MSTQKIIKELLDENLIGAKKEIEDLLYEKLGDHLNETYVELAPTLLGEKKKHKSEKKKHKKGAKPDFLDLDGDGDEEESMKKASKDKEMKEDYSEEGGSEEGGDTESSKQGASPAAATLRPGGAPRDEPGDLSKEKKEILAAIGKAGGANTAGTDGY